MSLLLSRIEIDKLLQDNEVLSINLFDRQISLILHEDSNPIPRCGACISSLGITPEGNIVGCSTLTGTKIERKCIIGNLITDVDRDKKDFFIAKLIDLSNRMDCIYCKYNKRCYNYCPSTNYLGSGDMFVVSTTHCQINKIVIKISEFIINHLQQYLPEVVERKYILT